MVANVNNEDVVAFSQLNAQLNSLGSQRNHLKLMIESTKRTIEELEASEEKTAFKNLGFVLLKCDKSKLVKDLKSEIETLELRTKTMEKSEEVLSKRLEQLKAKLDSQMPKHSEHDGHNHEGHNHKHEEEDNDDEDKEEQKSKKNKK